MHYLAQFETSTTEKLYYLKQFKEVLGGGTEILELLLPGIISILFLLIAGRSRQAVEAEDWIKASKIAHKIKPTIDSMNIRTGTLTDIRTLEKDAKNQVNTSALANIAVKVIL